MGKQFHDQKSETVSGLSREGRCSSLAMPSGGYAVWADAVKEGDSGKTAYYAVLEAAGNAAAAGAVPLAVSARILLPPEAEEEELRELAAGIRAACDEMCLKASCIQGEVSHAVRMSTAAVTVTGAAEHAPEERVYPGQEILLCGYTGLEGMLHILDEAEEELAERFVPSFLGQAGALQSDLVMPEQILAGCRTEASGGGRLISAARQIGSGGILAALWEMAEISGTGLEVSMEAMALKQETVEICEHFQINPYQMTSAGSYLIATEHAEELMGVLEKAGARAGRLGIAKAQNARVITSGDETRYLDRPAPDSLMCWQRERLFGNRAREYIS